MPIFHKQTEVVDRLTAELSGQSRDSLHCVYRDLTVITPCFERVLLETVDFFRGEQSGSMVKLW